MKQSQKEDNGRQTPCIAHCLSSSTQLAVKAMETAHWGVTIEDRKLGEGIYQFVVQSPGDVEPNIYEKPGYLIKYPIEVGHSWESRLLVRGVEFTTQSKIESTDEVITVPAGNFGCLRIKSVGSASKGHGQVSTESYSWYAQGVGLVKSIIKVKVTSGGIFPQQKHEEIMMELTDFRKE